MTFVNKASALVPDTRERLVRQHNEIQLHDVQFMIRTLPQKVDELFTLGYKMLFPEALITRLCTRPGRRTTPAASVSPVAGALLHLNALSNSFQLAGRSLGTLLQARPSLPPLRIPPSGLPDTLQAEIEALVDLLQGCQQSRSELLTSYHMSLTAVCRAAYRAARGGIAQQIARLVRENDRVRRVVEVEANEAWKARPETQAQLRSLRPRIERLYQNVLRKHNLSYAGLLSNQTIPWHSRIAQLLEASAMPVADSTKALRDRASALPRTSFQAMVKDLEQLNTRRKLAYTNASTEQIKTLNDQIEQLRLQIQEEIARNNNQTKDALRAYQELFHTGTSNPPSDDPPLRGGQTQAILDDMMRLSILFQLLHQNEDVALQKWSMNKTIATERLQRKGCGAFGLWFTSAFWGQIHGLVQSEMVQCRFRFMRQVQTLSEQTEHLIRELRRPKYFTVKQPIEAVVRASYQHMETQILAGHRQVFASLIDLCSEMTRPTPPTAL